MACQPDGLLLVRVLSLPAVVLWSAWWLMTTLWRAGQADTGSPCLCVYVWERAFTCWAGGPSLVAFSAREPPPPHSVCSPVAAGEEEEEEEEERCLRRRQGWLREDREGGQTQGIRRHTHCDGTSSEDTLSDLWPDCFTLLKGHSVVLEKELRILTFAVLVSS